MKIILSIMLCALLFPFFGCIKMEEKDFVTEGYKPIYLPYEQAYNINSSDPKGIINPGKIYVYDSLIFVVEKSTGIHIINNANPSNPIMLSFININGNLDIAIRNNNMYVDNFRDIVTLDISNIKNVREIHRIKNVYPSHYKNYPDENGWFECADSTKGIISGWIKTKITNPKCKRNVYYNEFE